MRSWTSTLAFRKGAANLLGVKDLGSEAGLLFLLLSGRQRGGERNKWHKKDSWGHWSVGEIKKTRVVKSAIKFLGIYLITSPSIYDGQQRRSPLFPTQDFFGDKKREADRPLTTAATDAIKWFSLWCGEHCFPVKKGDRRRQGHFFKRYVSFFPAPTPRRRPSIKNVTFETFIAPLRIYISFPYFWGGILVSPI